VFDDYLEQRVTAEPENIAPLRRAVVAFAADRGASDGELEDVALAVSEALTNTVLHAYVGRDSPGIVSVQAWMRERWLEVVVCDEGVGMLARSDSPGLGYGLSVIHRITARLEVQDTMPGVRLHMTFAIG
jgi:anti-sigma regulatory factor (Ser/Thr protein kinase)